VHVKTFRANCGDTMILTVGGEKGGVGKSTLAVHLCYMLAAAGRDPLLIDADPQGSASNFTAARDDRGAKPRLTCVQKLGKGLAHDVRALAARYSDVVIDTGGRDTAELRLAMLISETVVVPINCSAFNWWTLEKVDQLVGEALLSNPDLRSLVLLNRAPSNPMLRRRKIATARDRLASAEFSNLKLLDAALVERTVFQDNEEFGMTVWEASVLRGTIDSNACNEVAALYKEIFDHDFLAVGPAAIESTAA
jgi:chromosome partitioning protein